MSIIQRLALSFGLILSLGYSGQAIAQIEVYQFEHPAQEAQYQGLVEELRCPKCQNQNLAGSDAPIAKDLKQKTYELVLEGKSDGEIRDYMADRYGDFISYRPPFRPSTWVLWLLPPALLLLSLGGWVLFVRRLRLTGDKNATETSVTPDHLSPEDQRRLEAMLAPSQKTNQENQS